MKRLLMLIALLSCGDAAAFKPGALGGHSGLGRKCGALGNCGGSTYGFPKSAFVFVAAGNSITFGQDSTSTFTTQMSTMLTASGITHSMNNKGHGAYCTGSQAGCAGNLTEQIPTDVDPLWDGTKNNILIFQEVINDIYFGSTGAQAYAHVTTYFQTLARPGSWYKIVIMPTPRDNPGVSQPTYENERQAFIALANADPTFGGTVNALWRVDQDTRLGLAASDADGYYYYLSGGADTKTHWLYTAHAIAAAALMDILRAKDAGKFPYIPQHQPWASAAYSAAVTGSALTTSGGAATDGQVVATWTTAGGLEGGSAVQAGAGLQPTYSATGFGGRPALTMPDATTSMVTSATTLGSATFAFTFTSSAGGFAAYKNTTNAKYAVFDNVSSFSIFEAVGATNAAHYVPPGTFVGSVPHVAVFVYDGTFAGQQIWLDGTAVSLTQYLTYNGNPGNPPTSEVMTIGHPTASFVGKLGEFYASPIPFNATERKNLERYLGALRGITVAP